MKIGPKYKIAKRLGADIFEKTQTQKFALSQSRKDNRRSTPKTDYGKQFLEKQRIRFSYGITERQLRNYIREVLQSKKAGPGHLFSILERRLDNVIYRMGIAPTRRTARQFITHGHVILNGKKVSIPSYRTTPGEKISVRTGSRGSVIFQNMEERLKEHATPAWVSFDPKAIEGKVEREPELSGVNLAFDLAPV